MSKRDLDRKLDSIMKRARTRRLGILPIIDVLSWPEHAREAYMAAAAAGDEVRCDELILEHFGALPEPVGNEIVAIIVSGQVTPPDETDSEQD